MSLCCACAPTIIIAASRGPPRSGLPLRGVEAGDGSTVGAANNAAFVLFGLAAGAGATVGAVILPSVLAWLEGGVVGVVTFCMGNAEGLLL